MVAWADRHPRLALVPIAVMGLAATGSVVYGIAAVVTADWFGFVLFTGGFVLFGWTAWSWTRVRRGDATPTTWKG